MLARLDGIRGVEAARADASGQFFWLALARDADPARVAIEAREALGAGAALLADDDAEVQLARVARGDRWFGAADVLSLSLLEARVVATRVAAAAAGEVPGIAAARDRLADALRVELFDVMERVHREGGRARSGWIDEEWPAICEAAVARCGEALSPTDRDAAAAALRQRLRP